jgi:hypothetical protein
MQQPTPPWPPQEGTTIRLKGSGLVGTVIQTKGVYERRFRVTARPPDVGGDAVALKRAKATARRASRWYGLDEMEPPS